jgi:hypothetical protein
MKHSFGPKPLVFGLLAAFAFASVAPDAAAQRSPRRMPEGKPAAAGPQLDRVRGGAEAPAAVTASGIACTVTDAAFVGASNVTVNGVKSTRNAYEVSCQEGLGHIIFQPTTAGVGRAEAVDCLLVAANERLAKAQGNTSGVLSCRLPGNAQPATGLRTYLSQAGATCTPTQARYMGALQGGAGARYEVACSDGQGLVLDRALTGGARPTVVSCLSVLGTNSACQFTDKARLVASLSPVVAQARRECTVSDVRAAGRNPTTQAEVLEIGCSGGRPGFFVEVGANNQFVRAMECGSVRNEPCQFTSTEAVESVRKAELSQRLRAAGNDCAINQLRYIGKEASGGRDVFEASCSNRPDGVYALLPASGSTGAEIYDCLLAAKRGARCELTPESAVYPRLTSAVAGRLTNACTVNAARRLGTTTQGEDWYEIGCADGRQFLVDYAGNGRLRSFLNCREGSGILGGCRNGPTGSISRR